MAERKSSLVVSTSRNTSVVSFTDSRILEEMQIRNVGQDLYDLADRQFRKRIIISFQNVQLFSTALLAKLIGLKKRVTQLHGDVRLCSITANIMEVFKVTGLEAAFDIYKDERTAIDSFGQNT